MLKPLHSQSHIPKISVLEPPIVHLSPPDVHLPLLYPRYLGDLGLPHLFWGGSQSRLPQPHRHTHSLSAYRAVGREAKTPQFSATTHVSPAPFLSTMVLLLVTYGKWPSSLSQIHPLFGRHFLLCFVRGLPVQIGAMGRRVSPLPPSGGDLGPQ